MRLGFGCVAAIVLASVPASGRAVSGEALGPGRVASGGLGPQLASPRGEGEGGFLDISSDVPAKILIDGKETGRVTPQPHLGLAAGHHTLTLVTLDKKHQRSIGFTVGEGKTFTLSIHLAS